MFFAAVCALVSAGVFAFVVIARHNANDTSHRPLVATISDVQTVTDETGVSHFVVNGTVVNRSDDIYGVPDLIVISRDAAGHEIARQKFLPSATLLDAGASVGFTHTLSVPTTGIKKINVELGDLSE